MSRMNFRFTVVETSLNRAEFRWKGLKLLEQSFRFGSVLCVLVLLFGVAMIKGWVSSKSVATTFFTIVGVVGFIWWLVMIIRVFAGSPDRGWLAASVERVDRRLLDRLNTLLFLEKRRGDPRVEAFSVRIARQAQQLLSKKQSPSPFSGRRSLVYLLVFTMVLVGTLAFYQRYAPWQRLLIAQKANAIRTPAPPLNDLALATNTVEESKTWGEVRIIDPGTDLKLTKVDVLPLQIEAAANQSLKDVRWVSAVNGTDETPHELPPPNEPRYAVYQPTVYLDEMRLSDWDVMTYYARAQTEKENAFASEVYFVEVKPFREDLLKLPGGEGGKAHQCLNELSGLIYRQQHVIRQTHQHVQQPHETERLQLQDRKKLSDAETDLADSVKHFYAKMADSMENEPIGGLLDDLAKAEQSLQGASKNLDANLMSEAQNRERTGLTELVSARKAFQKMVSEHPEAFEEKDEERIPVPDASTQLSKMAEFRNEAKAAQDFVQKAMQQQKAIERQSKTATRADYSSLAQREAQLEKSLQDFQEQHPAAFKTAQAESEEARQAMSRAAESMQKRNPDARQATQEATRELEELGQALERNSSRKQLADAYRLKQMLDQQIQTFGQCANSAGAVPDGELQRTVNASQETINQLKKVAEQEPTRDAFGQPLRDSLNGENKVDLDAKLARLKQANDSAAKQQRAGEAAQALNKVSQAFTASEPKTLQMAEKTDVLSGANGSQDQLGLGLSQLNSLLKQLEREQPPSAEDQAKQKAEALFNLQNGARSYYGDNNGGEQLLVSVEKMLKAEQLDVGDLKKLIEQLQHFSVETSDQLAKKEDRPEVSNIDPARLPPAYRGRIQKYFQKLSEK
jgi:hypothetical protein